MRHPLPDWLIKCASLNVRISTWTISAHTRLWKQLVLLRPEITEAQVGKVFFAETNGDRYHLPGLGPQIATADASVLLSESSGEGRARTLFPPRLLLRSAWSV